MKLNEAKNEAKYLRGWKNWRRNLIFVFSLLIMLNLAIGCGRPAETTFIPETIEQTTEPTSGTEPADTVNETTRKTVKTTTTTVTESSSQAEETTETSNGEITEETTEETTIKPTTTKSTTKPVVAQPVVEEKPKNPYYLYAEKGSYTLAVYGLDDSNQYTRLIKTFRMAIGRGTMTPSGKFTLGRKSRWYNFGSTYKAQYAINYNSRLLIHGPLYEAEDNMRLRPEYYTSIGSQSTSGCLRLTTGDVLWIYNNIASGTTLEIVNGSPRGLSSSAPPPLIDESYDPTDPNVVRSINKPVISLSTSALTNQAVTVNINYGSQQLAYKEYRIGSGNWQKYSAPFTVGSNTTVYARSGDYAGNAADGSVAINNIDTTAPAAPTIVLSNTEPTNNDITVTINYPDEQVREYRIDENAWQAYSAPFKLSANATVYVRVVDAAGNTATASAIINNIDKTKPAAPVIKASVSEGKVIVTISAEAGAAVQYKLGDAQWQNYSSPFVVEVDTTVTARAVDAAGNLSDNSSQVVTIPEPTPVPTTASPTPSPEPPTPTPAPMTPEP